MQNTEINKITGIKHGDFVRYERKDGTVIFGKVVQAKTAFCETTVETESGTHHDCPEFGVDKVEITDIRPTSCDSCDGWDTKTDVKAIRLTSGFDGHVLKMDMCEAHRKQFGFYWGTE